MSGACDSLYFIRMARLCVWGGEMVDRESKAYFLDRERQELEAALAAKSVAAREVHQELARNYARRARAAEADAALERRRIQAASNLTGGET